MIVSPSLIFFNLKGFSPSLMIFKVSPSEISIFEKLFKIHLKLQLLYIYEAQNIVVNKMKHELCFFAL